MLRSSGGAHGLLRVEGADALLRQSEVHAALRCGDVHGLLVRGKVESLLRSDAVDGLLVRGKVEAVLRCDAVDGLLIDALLRCGGVDAMRPSGHVEGLERRGDVGVSACAAAHQCVEIKGGGRCRGRGRLKLVLMGGRRGWQRRVA